MKTQKTRRTFCRPKAQSDKPKRETPKTVKFTPIVALTRYLIGIDCGDNTGLAFWDSEKNEFLHVYTHNPLNALDMVRDFANKHKGNVTLFVENPYTFKTFYENGNAAKNAAILAKIKAKAQGAGSVKSHFKLWALLSIKDKIPMTGTSIIGGVKKQTADYFRMVTGYKGKLPDSKEAAEHCTDAGFIVFQRKTF